MNLVQLLRSCTKRLNYHLGRLTDEEITLKSLIKTSEYYAGNVNNSIAYTLAINQLNLHLKGYKGEYQAYFLDKKRRIEDKWETTTSMKLHSELP